VTLIYDWRTVLTRAWSIRLALVAGLLSGLEVLLPLMQDFIPRGPFGAASFVVTVAAVIARLVAQPKLHTEACS
jgi:hypothetical protein